MAERKSQVEMARICVNITANMHDRMMAYLAEQADYGRTPDTVTTLVLAALAEYLDKHQSGLYDDEPDELARYARR